MPSDSGLSSGSRPRVMPSETPRRILVVDDDVDSAELLGRLLRLSGHEVVIAMDPKVALERLASFEPEVAILDIGMPTMDGYELGSRVLERAPECRLIALSGYGQRSDLERSTSAGFAGHFLKPVKLPELLQLVDATTPR
jgi:CheY-like chemotaxis protein